MSLPLSDEQLAVLRAVVASRISGLGYLRRNTAQPISSTPWVFDDLERLGLIQDANGWLVPTISGLGQFDDESGQEALRDLKLVVQTLKDNFKSFYGKPITVEQIGRWCDLDPVRVGRLAPILGELNIFSSWTFVPQGNLGDLQTLELSPHILDVDPFVGATAGEEEETAVTLEAKDFRGLAGLRWEMDGVCLLAGTNGAGKTSVLEALAFLRDTFLGGIEEAVRKARGAFGLRRMGAEPRSMVELGIGIGRIRWKLRLPVEGGAPTAPGEDLWLGKETFLHRSPQAAEWYLGKRKQRGDERCCLRAAYDQERSPELVELVRLLRSYQIYGHYNLEEVRNGAPIIEEGKSLREDGKNLLSVLRTWHSAPVKYNQRFDWVMKQAREAFPSRLDHLEFETIGSLIQARLFLPGATGPAEGLPFHVASDGMLAGLLHLTAIAGAEEGSLIAIEELENHLHPHAIRVLVAAIREIAEERGVRVILTTHAFSLMNEFRRDYEHFYVLEAGDHGTPVRLDQLREPEYLAQFYPGELYDREDFGAPRKR
jgi:predicted ATPase